MQDTNAVKELIEALGGKVTEMVVLPDGSGFATASFPLPKDHWLTYPYSEDGHTTAYEPPPMPLILGADDTCVITVTSPHRPPTTRTFDRKGFDKMLEAAGRYAVRSATMQGKEEDFDPDALIQNLRVGMCGYYTADGLSGCDDWANPEQYRKGSAPGNSHAPAQS